MLNKLTLTNFQRHRSLDINFEPGITAIRAANESGKSTMIRGVCYALFGAKALGIPLADLVTWGEAENTLKVELTLTLDSVAYTIKRGKSGAELQADGLMVTGQNDVTDYVSRLLKVDAGSASRLMLASQNEVRGALESGTKATTELIEQLAEFDQIDHLIELMQEKLTLGSAAQAEAAVTSAQASLDAAREAAVPVNVQHYEKEIAAAKSLLEKADASVAANTRRIESLTADLAGLREQAVKRQAAQRALDDATARLERAEADIANAQKVKAPDSAHTLPALRERLVELADALALRTTYNKVLPYLGEPLYTGDRFEGTLEALNAEVRSTAEEAAKQTTLARDHRHAADLARSRISTGNCSTCGQPVDHLPEVAERNAALSSQASSSEASASRHAENAKSLQEYLGALEAVQKESGPRVSLLERFPDKVKALGNELPPALEWIGGAIPDNAEDETTRIKEAIAQHEAGQRTYDAAQGRLAQATSERAAASEALENAKAALVLRLEVDSARQEAELAEATAKRAELAATQRQAQRLLSDAENALANAQQAYTRAVDAVASCEVNLTVRKAELATLGFNNALLKRVRQCRPLIADRLWSLTLAAVSRYFSEMRGEESVVTKDSDGFKVNGHTVTTLSGSTLDILGLAIRVALTRTFLPTAPLLVLDEPFHGCDAQRTELSLGFLSSLGMNQVLLISHENISESVADAVIEL